VQDRALAHPCHGPLQMAQDLSLHGIQVRTVLSDNDREFRGRPDRHPYALFLQLEGIGHHGTRVNRPQSNCIAERFLRTLIDEHFRVEGRRTWFEMVEEMQTVRDTDLATYNEQRPHQGRSMSGRTPLRTFRDRAPANDKVKEDTAEPRVQTHAA